MHHLHLLHQFVNGASFGSMYVKQSGTPGIEMLAQAPRVGLVRLSVKSIHRKPEDESRLPRVARW